MTRILVDCVVCGRDGRLAPGDVTVIAGESGFAVSWTCAGCGTVHDRPLDYELHVRRLLLAGCRLEQRTGPDPISADEVEAFAAAVQDLDDVVAAIVDGGTPRT